MFGDRNITDPKQFEWAKEELASTLSEDLQKILVRWLFAAENCRLAAYMFNPTVTEGYTVGQLEQIWDVAKKTNIGKYTFEPEPKQEEEPQIQIPSWLSEVKPYDASAIASRVDYKHTEVTEVMLKNGFRLVLRPTNDEDDKVQLQIFARGGLSKAPENGYARYEGTAGYMELGGVERLSDGSYLP